MHFNNHESALPFEPEPASQLRARMPDALYEIYSVLDILAGKAETPGKFRRHVFDFPHGVRMILSKEKYHLLNNGEPFVHASFSISVPNYKKSSLRAVLKDFGRIHDKLLKQFKLEPVGTYSTKVVAHFILREKK